MNQIIHFEFHVLYCIRLIVVHILRLIMYVSGERADRMPHQRIDRHVGCTMGDITLNCPRTWKCLSWTNTFVVLRFESGLSVVVKTAPGTNDCSWSSSGDGVSGTMVMLPSSTSSSSHARRGRSNPALERRMLW